MIRKENRFFDVSPRLVRAGRETEIIVRPLYDHCRFSVAATYQVIVWPLEGAVGQTTNWWVEAQPVTPHTLADGLLRFSYCFEGEQEYAVLLHAVADGKRTPIAEFRLYALKNDLFCRRPYKGDTHMHSYRGEGPVSESPAYLAAACRRIGLDWMAVTDHCRYAPSLEAMRAFEGVPTDLRIYPGEEVHAPGNWVHMVNFGGKFSINDLFKTDSYRAEVKAIEDTLTDLPPGVNPYTYSSCVWCFNKIRQAGGLGVFCHPYWLVFNRYDVPAYLADLLFERQPFDAIELIAGYHRHELESNHLQVVRYYAEQARGKKIPIVGSSDTHGCERGDLFGWYYTVAFASSTDLPDLIQGIKDLYSVAVEALPGETARAFGPFRLVKYAQFLMREIFPLHDELCVEEGRLMLAHVAGDKTAARMLSMYLGRTPALYDHLWGNKP